MCSALAGASRSRRAEIRVVTHDTLASGSLVRATEMVDVMKADIAGKPLQHPRKFQIGAALERCLHVVPV